MYLYVFVCICMYLYVFVCICMYLYVFVCIWLLFKHQPERVSPKRTLCWPEERACAEDQSRERSSAIEALRPSNTFDSASLVSAACRERERESARAEVSSSGISGVVAK